MTSTPLKPLVTLYLFPTGRRVFALQRVSELLAGQGHQRLRHEVEGAIAADLATYELELHYRKRDASKQHAQEATQLDAKLDRALSALDANLASTQRAFGEDSARGRLAAFARGRLFPKGVRHVTHLAYVEEHSAVNGILDRARTEPELRKALGALGAADIVARVAELNAPYGEALSVSEAPTFAEVSEARAAGQERLARILILISSGLAWSDCSATDRELLEAALRTILTQNESIRLHRQRRRAVRDVNPTTGEELGLNLEEESTQERANADAA